MCKPFPKLKKAFKIRYSDLENEVLELQGGENELVVGRQRARLILVERLLI